MKDFKVAYVVKEEVINKESDYKYDSCEKHFKTNQGRTTHSKVHRKVTEEVQKYPCSLCGKVKST